MRNWFIATKALLWTPKLFNFTCGLPRIFHGPWLRTTGLKSTSLFALSVRSVIFIFQFLNYLFTVAPSVQRLRQKMYSVGISAVLEELLFYLKAFFLLNKLSDDILSEYLLVRGTNKQPTKFGYVLRIAGIVADILNVKPFPDHLLIITGRYTFFYKKKVYKNIRLKWSKS